MKKIFLFTTLFALFCSCGKTKPPKEVVYQIPHPPWEAIDTVGLIK